MLWNFGSGTDGANPGYGDLIWDDQGNIYDTTVQGGSYGSGTVYELTKVGNVWTEEVYIAFNSGDYEGCPAGSPWSGGHLFQWRLFWHGFGRSRSGASL